MESCRSFSGLCRRIGAIGALGVAVAACAAPAAGATVVYTETFPNAGTNAAFSTVGWNANIGTTGTADNSNADSVVSNATGKDGAIGYGAKTGTSTGPGFYWTTEAGSIPQADLDSVTFFSNNSNTAEVLRLAIRLDNNTPGNAADDTWYVSNQAAVRNSGTAGSSTNWVANGELETFAFSAAGSNWIDFNFVSGSAMTTATAARSSPLPAGNVNALGVYGSGAAFNSTITGVIRFDTFQVSTVPEPTSLAAAAGLGAVGLLRRRRRA